MSNLFDASGNIIQPIIFGCTLQSISITSKRFGVASYDITLLREPGQIFSGDTSGILDGKFGIQIGAAVIVGQIRNFDEIITNPNGTGVISIQANEIGLSAKSKFDQAIAEINDPNIPRTLEQVLPLHEGKIISLRTGKSTFVVNLERAIEDYDYSPSGIDALYLEALNDWKELNPIDVYKGKIPQLTPVPGIPYGGPLFAEFLIEADFPSPIPENMPRFTKLVQLGSELEVADIPRIQMPVLVLPTRGQIFKFLNPDLAYDGDAFQNDLNTIFGSVTSEEERLEKNALIQRRLDALIEASSIVESFPDTTTQLSKLRIQFSKTGVKTKYTFGFLPTRRSASEKLEDEVDKHHRNKKRERIRIPKMDQNILDFINRCQELRAAGADSPCIDTILDFELDALTAREKIIDELLGTLSSVNWDSIEYWYPKMQGGRGIIKGRSVRGPFYSIQKLGLVDINPQIGSILSSVTNVFEGWNDVRNLAEPLASPGYLQIDDLVDVKIFFEGLQAGSDPFEIGTPFIEVAPQVFAPPAPTEE